jgi:hypothetical protein
MEEWYIDKYLTDRQINLIEGHNMNIKTIKKKLQKILFDKILHFDYTKTFQEAKFPEKITKGNIIYISDKWIIVKYYITNSALMRIFHKSTLKEYFYFFYPEIGDFVYHFYNDFLVVISDDDDNSFYYHIPTKKKVNLLNLIRNTFYKRNFCILKTESIQLMCMHETKVQLVRNFDIPMSFYENTHVCMNEDFLVVLIFDEYYTGLFLIIWDLHSFQLIKKDYLVPNATEEIEFNIYNNVLYGSELNMLCYNLKTFEKFVEPQNGKYIVTFIRDSPLCLCRNDPNNWEYFIYNYITKTCFKKFEGGLEIWNLTYIQRGLEYFCFDLNIDKILIDMISKKEEIVERKIAIEAGEQSNEWRDAKARFSKKARNFKSPEMVRKFANVTKTGIPRYPLHELRSMTYPFKTKI